MIGLATNGPKMTTKEHRAKLNKAITENNMSQNEISTLRPEKLLGKTLAKDVKRAQALEKIKIAEKDKTHHAKLREKIREAEKKLMKKTQEDLMIQKTQIQEFLSNDDG
jgi:hypothetical protein